MKYLFISMMLLWTMASRSGKARAFLWNSRVPTGLSECYHGVRVHRKSMFYRSIHKSFALYLNRFLFDVSEVNTDTDDKIPTVTLPIGDYRTIHAAKILGLHNGDRLRAGIVNGEVTDSATVTWIPEGKIKKAEPTKNGDPPGSLVVTLNCLETPVNDNKSEVFHVSMILALPRPLALSRILPMIAQVGVDHLILSTAQKVPKDYFGSHLFRKPEELRKHLIEGLCQAGDVKLPKITIVKRLKPFLEDELDTIFPSETVARVIAHPFRQGQDTPTRMRDIQFPSQNNKNILIAVGPEGGWAEDYELDLFKSKEFQQITLGSRTLRSDVAVVSLLSLAHDLCAK